MKEKRGISAAVTSVLIVLMSVMSVGIVWFSVGSITEAGLDFDNVDSRMEIITSTGYTVYDPEEDVIFIQVERKGDSPVDALMIYIEFGGDTFSQLVTAPLVNSKKTYNFTLSGYDTPPESISVASVTFKGLVPIIGAISSTVAVPINTLSPDVLSIGGLIPPQFGLNNDLSSISTPGGANPVITGANFDCLNDSLQVCEGIVTTGVCENSFELCEGGFWGVCHDDPGFENSVEVTCNDGLDNDCDGETDSGDLDCSGDLIVDPLSVGRILYLSFDSILSNSSTDETGENDLIVFGDPVFDPSGVLDGSYVFDGDGDYIDFGHKNIFNIGIGDFSYSYWFKSNSNSSQAIFQKGFSNYNSPSTFFLYNVYGSFIGDYNLNKTFFFSNTQFESSILYLNKSLTEGSWHHVVLNYREVDYYPDHLEYYVDSVLVSNESIVDGPIVIDTIDFPDNSISTAGGTASLVLGTDLAYSPSNFNGSLDEFMMFNRTLSSAEITSLYLNI